MDQLSLPLSSDSSARFERPEFLTIAEAARRVRCCERTIRRAIDSGDLRAGRVRGRAEARGGFRIRVDDLERWLYDDAS